MINWTGAGKLQKETMDGYSQCGIHFGFEDYGKLEERVDGSVLENLVASIAFNYIYVTLSLESFPSGSFILYQSRFFTPKTYTNTHTHTLNLTKLSKKAIFLFVNSL